MFNSAYYGGNSSTGGLGLQGVVVVEWMEPVL